MKPRRDSGSTWRDRPTMSCMSLGFCTFMKVPLPWGAGKPACLVRTACTRPPGWHLVNARDVELFRAQFLDDRVDNARVHWFDGGREDCGNAAVAADQVFV